MSKLLIISEQLATQDNRATAVPLFAVEQKRRVYGLKPEWAAQVTWLCHLNGETTEVEEDGREALEAGWVETGKSPKGYERIGFFDYWEFVTACFTEAGAQAYIEANGHNLHSPRIYAHGTYRNQEWEIIRDFLRDAVPALQK